jgi:hypothetical protein
MKPSMKYSIFFAAGLFLLFSCKRYLDVSPQGTLTEGQVTTPENVDGLVTAAYASIGNDVFTGPITSMWIYGSVHSDDAYKGGGAVDDLAEYNPYEQYNTLVATNNGSVFGFPSTWTTAYAAMSRVNIALRTLNALTDDQFAGRQARLGEMHFLRGHLYFIMKIMFKYFPWVDENATDADIIQISNRQYTNDELWEKIAAEFQEAVNTLPPSQAEPGRANQIAAKAYLAKVRLYQAYEQDENHNVVSINSTHLNEVVSLTSDVINSGQYQLNDDFAKNFLYGYDNGPESIFAIQYSINDGTAFGRISESTGLNYSLAPQYGCCWFHIPSQNMVNAFQTTAAGLPNFDHFNDVELGDDNLTPTGITVDPRIDHTIGLQGHPFKYQPDVLYDHSWERAGAIYGHFGNMKEEQAATCACFKKQGPFYGSSVNIDIIRYADVLLWKAEALIQLNRQAEALPLINEIRTRSANSTNMTRFADGTAPSNYNISNYIDGVNVNWTKENAFKALQWERRMEFAMESPRFFDLVRWGIAAETLNAYLDVEKLRHPYLANAHFIKNRNEYFPIPQREIDFTKGLYIQNPGY